VSDAVAFHRNALQLRTLFLFELPRFPIMTPIQVKICGVTNLEDASACAKLGAALIGLNFYPQSPRYVEPKAARRIVEALPARVCAVGVFVDSNTKEIRSVAGLTGIRSVQLHGDFSAETCSELAGEFRVVRALSTDARFKPESAAAFPDCDVLVDAHHPELRGGTGQTCDWSSARATLRFTRFLILSGGLRALNVVRAIEAVAPHAVDVCSGVESLPGVKDHRALKDFMCAVRIAEQSLHAESADKASQSVILSEAKDL
jgi:phosphoribosylanthranilate isomerase